MFTSPLYAHISIWESTSWQSTSRTNIEFLQANNKKYTVMSINEGTQLADYMQLIIQLSSQSISLILSMQKSKYTTYLSQVTDKCCTLTLKYSNCPVAFATPLENGWDIYWYPLICAMCYVLLSLLVWCVIAHKGHQANFMNMPVMFRGLRLGGHVGIRLKPLGNAAYVACLPLLCQGFKWLSGKSIWLVFRGSLVNCWTFCMCILPVNSKHILLYFH